MTNQVADEDKGLISPNKQRSDGLYEVSMGGADDPDHRGGRFPWPTLAERVVGFMDRYNESVRG